MCAIEECKRIIHETVKEELNLDSSDLVFITDENANALYVSLGYKRILGYDPEQIIGKSMWDYIHPLDVPLTRSLYSKMSDTNEKTSSSLRLKHIDGSWVKIKSLRFPISKEEQVKGYVVVSNQTRQINIGSLLKRLEECICFAV